MVALCFASCRLGGRQGNREAIAATKRAKGKRRRTAARVSDQGAIPVPRRSSLDPKKRDMSVTPEPRGTASPKLPGALRRRDARRPPAPFRSSPGARRRHEELGGDARPEPRSRRQAPRRAHRGSSPWPRTFEGASPRGEHGGSRGHAVGPRPLAAARRSARGSRQRRAQVRPRGRAAQGRLRPRAARQEGARERARTGSSSRSATRTPSGTGASATIG